MSDIKIKIETALQEAVASVLGNEYANIDPIVRVSGNEKFGDYQANLAMALGKKIGKNPRDIAQAIVKAIDSALFEKVEIAGPGFINLTLSTEQLNKQAVQMLESPKLDAGESGRDIEPKRVVIDYSAPNVAKQMHVGHLRSTVIGDALCRVLSFQGHKVIRQNHLGDWGTQFGMLIELMEDLSGNSNSAQNLPIDNLDKLYKQASKKYNEDQEFAKRARERVVALQSGDKNTLQTWRHLVEESKKHFNSNYARLEVLLENNDVKAESSYNNELNKVVQNLEKAGELKKSQGAKVVYPNGFKNKEGQPLAMIVQKSDGGFLYATTDLAAALYRINKLKAQRIIYVTDSRQSQHFALIFQTLNQCGWSKNVRLDHVSFGTILGKDHKPFKTRSGETVKLADLIDEAERRAQKIIDNKSLDLEEDKRRQIAHTIAIGALKYGDLSSDHVKDYVFDLDRMLAMDGNTAPYLQNAYVRICSIFRKANINSDTDITSKIDINKPDEKALVLKLLQFPQIVTSVGQKLEPHLLCTFLYELATSFHKFYEKCPVLNADDTDTKQSRLALCKLTSTTLKTGLNLLGIDTVKRM